MQVPLWMANEISFEASPPNNVIFRNFFICSHHVACEVSWQFLA